VQPPYGICSLKGFVPCLVDYLLETWDLQPVGLKSKAFEFTHCRIPLENKMAVIRDGVRLGVKVCCRKKLFSRGGTENSINFDHHCFRLGTSPSGFSCMEQKLSKLQLVQHSLESSHQPSIEPGVTFILGFVD
jgi:hypothetical protein